MSWFKELLDSSLGTVAETAGAVIDSLHTSETEKTDAKRRLADVLRAHEQALEISLRRQLAAKQKVLVAELSQGDTFTRRARPMVVYVGLAFIFFNYCAVPFVQFIAGADAFHPFELPGYFWAAWGGIVGTWAIGRTVEKRGAANELTRLITGAKPVSKLLDIGE
ncbi:MAG: hypothetical protein MAG453_01052 [Calditrichaeota bacterium]|nr:hypothetical protein [Calditrichota bacterium]